MLDIASSVSSFLSAPAALVRVLTFEGFGGRREGEATIRSSNGRSVGSILSGAADATLAMLDLSVPAIVRVPVGDDEAVRLGLACGGTAELLVQPLATIPERVWVGIQRREAFVLATFLDGARCGESVVVVVGEVDSSLAGAVLDAAHEQLRKCKARTSTLQTEVENVHFETVSPQPCTLVIGAAELATAIQHQGALLGWTTQVIDERVESGLAQSVAAATALGAVDALIVLSHDLPISCATLAAALKGNCGYVGALGSRHTQAARRERLIQVDGLTDTETSRVHGPIGLDLGSRTPEETALAIFAEILSVRGGRTATSLSTTNSPING